MILNSEPDWHAAGQDLISGICALEKPELQIELVESVCTQLGDALYPALLQILQIIEEHGDEQACKLMASTLVQCLQMGRLPAGKLSAWGASRISGDTAFGQSRKLGPIEYVCAWYAQPTTEDQLSKQQFINILKSLMSLVSSDKLAQALYCRKLQADSEDPMGGSLSSKTRIGLDVLSSRWESSNDKQSRDAAIDSFLTAIEQENVLNLICQRPFD